MKSSDLAIEAHDLRKAFDLPEERITSLKQLFVRLGRRGGKKRQEVLQGVSFQVRHGEFVGIVGRNGSGKSTLLKLLAGVYSPDSGSVKVHGKMAPFIELGVGFNPELTGRDNVFLNGALLGFTHKEMDAMYDSIVEFAELEPFMDRKLKNYSSGMQVRLAFSIAIKAKSEILLIDEVLAVGDANFQKKCMDIFEDLKRQGRTIILVTHSMEHVRTFCNRVIVIDKGDVVVDGGPEKAIAVYDELNLGAETETPQGQIAAGERFGNGKARIETYTFFNQDGKKTTKLVTSNQFSVDLDVSFLGHVTNPVVGVMFRKNPEENLLGINNFCRNQQFGAQEAGDKLALTVSGTLPLNPGTYYVTFTVADTKSASVYTELDILNNAAKITVTSDEEYWGPVASDIKMEIR